MKRNRNNKTINIYFNDNDECEQSRKRAQEATQEGNSRILDEKTSEARFFSKSPQREATNEAQNGIEQNIDADLAVASCDDFARFGVRGAGSYLNGNDQAECEQSHKRVQEATQGAGVWNMEQNDPDPFMLELNKQGLPYIVLEIFEDGTRKILEDGRKLD